MSSQNLLLEHCERALRAALAAGADEAEVIADAGRSVEIAIQKNDLEQVRSADEVTYGVRVRVGDRLGFATGNQASGLRALGEEAVLIAKSSPPEPGLRLPALSGDHFAPEALDPELLRLLEPEGRGELCALATRTLRRALAADRRMTIDTGELSVSELQRVLVSSAGGRRAWRGLEASGGLFGMAVDGAEVGSFAYDGDRSRRWAELEPLLERATDRFVRKCVGALGAQAGESFRGSILVPADCVSELLLDSLTELVGADAVRQGRSPLGERLGQAIAAPAFTLREAGAGLPGFALAPFDREGVLRSPLPIVQNGVLSALLYDSAEACRSGAPGRQSSGHAQGGAASPPMVGPAALELEAGDLPWAGLCAVERGVIVTRFSGTVEPSSGDFSGVVKGGFLVRGGEARPVAETTISGNLYEALRNISGISAERELLGGTSLLPGLRIEDISITAAG